MPYPTDLSYEKLCSNYDLVINESINLAPPEDRTIFDISEYRHYEEVISNWYAFFFDPSAEHSLRDLFLQSLVEIINEDKDHREFSMEDCRIEREFPTEKRGFIDLVLYEQSEENENFETAIIIENKIYAGINNDLHDYYNSLTVESGQKVGVVMSLKKIKVLPHQKFLNITHEELLGAIQRNLGKYVVSANPKYIPYLQDFILNLEQMTRPEKMQDSIKYYFDNATKIDELLNLRDQAEVYLRDNLRKSVEGNNYEWKSKAEGAFRFAYTFGDSNYCVMFYLYYIETIRIKKKFLLSVWLYGEEVVEHWRCVNGREKIRRNEYQLKFNFNQNSHGEGKKWAYLAEQKYKIPDIEKFGEAVFKFVKEDWSEFLKDVTDILN